MSDYPKHDPDVIPPTPHGPGEDWPSTHEIMVGVGSFANADADYEYAEYEPVVHLHPGPLGFVAVPQGKPKRRRRK